MHETTQSKQSTVHNQVFKFFLYHNVLTNCSNLVSVRRLNEAIDDSFQQRYNALFYVQKLLSYKEKNLHFFIFRVIMFPYVAQTLSA